MEDKSKLLKDLENYQAEIKSLREQLAEATGNKDQILEALEPKIELAQPEEPESNNHDYFNEINFDDNYGIKIMSISKTHHVTLSTGGYGRGKVFNLPHFGDTVIVTYADLVNIMQFHKNLFVDGYFTILSSDYLKKWGLLEVSRAILSKDVIESIIAGYVEIDSVIALFKTCPKAQKEMLISCIVDRLVEDENAFDSYFIQKFINISGLSLLEMVDEKKEYLNIYSEGG